MSELSYPRSISGACLACKQLKRKCNRVLPACGTCAKVGRACRYQIDPLAHTQRQRDRRSPLTPELRDGNTGEFPPRHSQSDNPPRSIPNRAIVSVDSYSYDTLQKPVVEATICRDAIEILGDLDDVKAVAATYFDNLSHRMPFIWKVRFNSRLQSVYTNPKADFSLLCLCISLAVQYPPSHGQNVQSSTYAMIKKHISLLEACGALSLDFVQARLLLAIFEVGHGLYPAASISAGSCARTARALGLNQKRFGPSFSNELARQRAEEEKRTWWEIVVLDRFINISTGDALFATEDPSAEDELPIADEEWAEDPFQYISHTISSPTNIRVSPFARECQIVHLMSRVLRHVFEPSSDPSFHQQEFAQLENTLKPFFLLLRQEQNGYVEYCAALSMCSCTLFLLYESELLIRQHDEEAKIRILNLIETTASHLVEIASQLFDPIENIDMGKLSPYVFYSIYQTAAVHCRLWKVTKQKTHGDNLCFMKGLLGHFNTRWRVAGIYLDAVNALENLDVSLPVSLHSMLGASVSTRGPSYKTSQHHF